MTSKPNIRYNVKFYKKGVMVYISHLDLMRLFRRVMRRADLPFFLTEGFTPRVKISVPKALKTGVESEREEMRLWLTEERDCEKLSELLNRELPEGIGVWEVVKE